MEILEYVLAWLSVLFFVATAVGLVKPGLVRRSSRGQVLAIYGGGTLLLSFATTVVVPEVGDRPSPFDDPVEGGLLIVRELSKDDYIESYGWAHDAGQTPRGLSVFEMPVAIVTSRLDGQDLSAPGLVPLLCDVTVGKDPDRWAAYGSVIFVQSGIGWDGTGWRFDNWAVLCADPENERLFDATAISIGWFAWATPLHVRSNSEDIYYGTWKQMNR